MDCKIILNFTRIDQGGGGQNALSFLQNLRIIDHTDKYIVVARNASIIFNTALKIGFDVIGTNKNEMDFICRRLFSKGQVCFTFFGPPWFMSRNYLINICGVAYSNLFYPEIDFWNYFSGIKKINKQIKDALRFYQLRWSDFWIFETESIAQRAISLAAYPANRVGVVRMSPSSLIGPEKIRNSWVTEFESMLRPNSFRLLFLASDNPNKRIIKISSILSGILQKYNPDFDIEIITTLKDNSSYFKKIYESFCFYGIEKNLINLGTVSYDKVSSLISCCNAICLFSILESFSNNMVEAWIMGIPLVVTDSDWARTQAENAAIYINPNDTDTSIDIIWNLIKNSKLVMEVINNGYEQLKKFPTPEEKTEKYLSYIKAVSNMGILGKKRSKIKYFTIR